jgi:hypothetical protein
MLLNKNYDTATDVFGLGVLMYELFSRYLRSVIVCTNRDDPKLLQNYAYKVGTAVFAGQACPAQG